jgi:hypothetical protein
MTFIQYNILIIVKTSEISAIVTKSAVWTLGFESVGLNSE